MADSLSEIIHGENVSFGHSSLKIISKPTKIRTRCNRCGAVYECDGPDYKKHFSRPDMHGKVGWCRNCPGDVFLVDSYSPQVVRCFYCGMIGQSSEQQCQSCGAPLEEE